MKRTIAAIVLLALSLGSGISATDYFAKVNTLIGTKGVGLTSGYLYPGATYPFGMVQFTPSYFSKRAGFVINQLSGGGCEHMGNFPTFPLKGKLTVSPGNILDHRVNVDGEKGHAGYYQAMVQGDIKTELTVTERTGMARYSYAQGENYGTVIIGGGVAATATTTAAVVITGKNTCEGYAVGGSCGGSPTPYKVYFAAEFDANAVETGVWKNDKLKPGVNFSEGETSGVYFTFDLSAGKQVQYKVGVSYVSVENARENLKTENPGWDFDAVQSRAEGEWNRYLSKVDQPRSHHTILHTSLSCIYSSHCR